MGTQPFDTGLGTTYERFALNAWLNTIVDKYAPTSVLEGPGDGMTGIPGLNSLPFAHRDIKVAVSLDNEESIALAQQAWRSQNRLGCVQFLRGFDDHFPPIGQSFDLVWNFNRLPFLDPDELLDQMITLAERFIVLGVPNRLNYAFPVRRLYHYRTKEAWPYGDIRLMKPKVVTRMLEERGLEVLETAWVDVPWWPDVIDISELVAGIAPFLSRFIPERESRQAAYHWAPEELPYFDEAKYKDLHATMNRLFFIERLRPTWLRIPFAHHFVVLAKKH